MANEGSESGVESWRQTVRDGDCFVWQISLNLPLLEKARIDPQCDPKNRSSSDPIKEFGGDGATVSKEQGKAIDYLIENHESLYPRVLKSLAEYAKQFRPDWVKINPVLADRVVPHNMTTDQIERRVNFTSVYITPETRDGMAYVELYGECTWDPDHGFNVVIHRDRIVEVCQQGTGWVDQ